MSVAIKPLSFSAHGHLKVRDATAFPHLREEQLIPLVMQEFVRVAGDFPIVFAKDAANGKFQPVALMGLVPKENLFCSERDWDFAYAPLALRMQPFSLADSGRNDNQLTVCLNEASPLVSGQQGQALFDSNGGQTEYLKQRCETAVQFIEQRQITGNIVELLANRNLLSVRDLGIKLADGQSIKINGIYVIDETKLNQLSDADFADLRSRGILPAIYAHLQSLQQFHKLARKKLEG